MLDFDIISIIIFMIIYLFIVTIFKLIFKKTLAFLFIFSLFYLYLVMVIDYTQFPIIYDSDIAEDFKELTVRSSFNIVPLVTLTQGDLLTSILNIILFMPFGFLFFILSRFHYKTTILAGISTSIIVELLQLINALVTGVYFRVVDINDVLFNTLGLIIGLLCYKLLCYISIKVPSLKNIKRNNFISYILSE